MGEIFINENFLLESKQAQTLFHEYAKDLPIVDYHCHLPPQQVAGDYQFANLAEIWLGGDHYKWRVMRTNGIDEKFITGDSTAWEKFDKWSQTVPYTLRNPMYHWTHLELKRPFGISDRLLNPENAKSIWDECNEKLARPEFSARGIMKQMKVALVCTTDDPVDSLEHHKAVAEDDSFDVQMLPTFRPDKGMAVDNPALFNGWVDKLIEVSGVEVKDVESLLEAVDKRHEFFHNNGCRLSDHGVETIYGDEYTSAELDAIFAKTRSGEIPTCQEVRKFKSAMLHEFAKMDYKRGWTQQVHYGAMRNNNTRMFEKLGPDTGYDSIGDWSVAQAMSRFLDKLALGDMLPKTIIYNLNPCDNELIATMLGNFQDGSVPGKIQFGSGWWFLDQIDGMTRQMEALSQLSLLSRFVGMLTDSRSFLSYTRHEYFRRLLCNILGGEMKRGLLPNDLKLVGRMVEDISYYNAANYFGFNLPGRG